MSLRNDSYHIEEISPLGACQIWNWHLWHDSFQTGTWRISTRHDVETSMIYVCTYACVVSKAWIMSCRTYACRVMSCRTYASTISHTCMIHVAQLLGSCRAYNYVKCQVWKHFWMSHDMYEWVTAHKSWHTHKREMVCDPGWQTYVNVCKNTHVVCMNGCSMYVCSLVDFGVCLFHTYTHTHTNTCVYVCVNVCLLIFLLVCLHGRHVCIACMCVVHACVHCIHASSAHIPSVHTHCTVASTHVAP